MYQVPKTTLRLIDVLGGPQDSSQSCIHILIYYSERRKRKSTKVNRTWAKVQGETRWKASKSLSQWSHIEHTESQ